MFLIGEEDLADSTIAKRLQRTRQMFAAMRRRKLINENPFSEVSHSEGDVTAKQRFIGREETSKLIEVAPNWDWRSIIALARYGGLRCPSEVLSVRWVDVDWEKSRLRVISPKTEYRAGKGCRTIPLFPELRPFLEEAWDMAADGQEYVIPEEYRKAALGPDGWKNCNLRTQFLRIVDRAGLDPWPKPFQNLRSSRETELAKDYPIHVAAAWLGNSPKVALKHYLQVTESDFAKAVQEAVQPALGRSNQGSPKKPQNPVFAEKDEACGVVQSHQVPEVGFEPTTTGL